VSFSISEISSSIVEIILSVKNFFASNKFSKTITSDMFSKNNSSKPVEIL
jgi:hypothetical protein